MSAEKEQKIKSGSILLIDVGTATVSAGVVTTGKNGTPKLDFVEVVPIGTGSETAREALQAHVDEALKSLLGQFSKQTIKKVRIVLAAPWYEARIRTIVSNSEKAVPISEKTILRAVEQYKAEAPPKSGYQDVEALAVQIKVNGYNTFLKRPVVGSSLEVNYYESEADSIIAKKITAQVASVFPHAQLSFHTFPLVSAIALRSLTDETSFAILDIAGEVTELSVLYEDGLRYHSSFSTGYYGIARTIRSKDGALGDSLSRLALYARDELSDEEKVVVHEEFTKAFTGWVTDFDAALKSASATVPIPQTLYVISDKEPLSWIRKGLLEYNSLSLNIEPVNATTVQNLLEIGEKGSYDVFLSLSALYFHVYAPELIGE